MKLFKKKAKPPDFLKVEDSLMRYLFPGTLCNLMDAGIPKEYAETLARQIIQHGMIDFHKNNVSDYVPWYVDKECKKIKDSVMAKAGDQNGQLKPMA